MADSSLSLWAQPTYYSLHTYTHTTSSIFTQLSHRQTHLSLYNFSLRMSSPRLIMTPWVCARVCVCVCGGGVVTVAPQHPLKGVSNCIHTYQQQWGDLFILKDIATVHYIKFCSSHGNRIHCRERVIATMGMWSSSFLPKAFFHQKQTVFLTSFPSIFSKIIISFKMWYYNWVFLSFNNSYNHLICWCEISMRWQVRVRTCEDIWAGECDQGFVVLIIVHSWCHHQLSKWG